MMRKIYRAMQALVRPVLRREAPGDSLPDAAGRPQIPCSMTRSDALRI